MIIKSHIRGGYKEAAAYLKAKGENEKTRLVEISDPDAKDLDEAFQKMWEVASTTKVKKALHHISTNPYADERLSKRQLLKIVKRCEEKYGYKEGDHQRVIVEHIKNGRQHFHVIWNRVSLEQGKAIWPGEHWKKSKQAAREMERELGLKRPIPRRLKRKEKSQRPQTTKSPPPVAAPMNPASRQTKEPNATSQPIRKSPSVQDQNNWPPEAIADWNSWGQQNPKLFFDIWSKLRPDVFRGMGP